MNATESATNATSAGTATPRLRDPRQSIRARGEPLLWLCGGSLAACLFMVFGLLLLVVVQGTTTFWPTALVEVRMHDGSVRLGEVTKEETYTPSEQQLAAMPATAARPAGEVGRRQLRTGNYDLTGEHFHWVPDFAVAAERLPADAVLVERRTWGRFYGYPTRFELDGATVVKGPADTLARVLEELPAAQARVAAAERIRKHEIGRLSDLEEDARLRVRKAELQSGPGSVEAERARAAAEALTATHESMRADLEQRLRTTEAENNRRTVVLTTADGTPKALAIGDIVRMHAPNALGFGERLGVYLDRWREFLWDDPRESNTEGGVWPAIFGTVLMTLIMTILVVPLGVLAALYMREYAKAGLVISAVRIAVNNLAGVPSIVFGVFGLGFFCYIVGGSIDSLFFPERLPAPTFGKGALLWASLTLALLTLPVVIVATEEALAAVPSSMREGSYACGASKWQTIRRIVLPRAMPGIMTGAILAMARGAGEVAPLMLVGAVKLAPELPLDGEFPYLHPSRSFMHLGFHIFDLGFQSQNSEAAKPMVFTTTLLLIGVITLLNVTAIALRTRLRRRFAHGQF